MRALVVTGGGADYHDQKGGHWIDGQIATPMSVYPEYRATRSSFGLNVLGTVVVEVEAEDGTVGVGTSTGGPPAAWLVENHFSRFVEGKRPDELELMWDQMWRASMFVVMRALYQVGPTEAVRIGPCVARTHGPRLLEPPDSSFATRTSSA